VGKATGVGSDWGWFGKENRLLFYVDAGSADTAKYMEFLGSVSAGEKCLPVLRQRITS